MERREVFPLVFGAVVGTLMGVRPAEAAPGASTKTEPARVFLQEMAATIKSYQRLLETSPNLEAWPALRQLENFCRCYEVQASKGGYRVSVVARTQEGLLDLKFTTQGPPDALRQLSNELRAAFIPHHQGEGALVVTTASVTESKHVHDVLVRATHNMRGST